MGKNSDGDEINEYERKYKENIKEKQFIDDLRIKNGNLKIILSHPIKEGDL